MLGGRLRGGLRLGSVCPFLASDVTSETQVPCQQNRVKSSVDCSGVGLGLLEFELWCGRIRADRILDLFRLLDLTFPRKGLRTAGISPASQSLAALLSLEVLVVHTCAWIALHQECRDLFREPETLDQECKRENDSGALVLNLWVATHLGASNSLYQILTL